MRLSISMCDSVNNRMWEDLQMTLVNHKLFNMTLYIYIIIKKIIPSQMMDIKRFIRKKKSP